ncbi:MAG: 50S ribosomal protein L19 [Clostridiales bacterium]|jgi:large subunit ribosomal protein L19|nr:50S ribosomal protein L19 [Clostridiales bacterium]
MNEIIKAIAQEQIRSDLPEVLVGDTVQVFIKIKEGNRERVQMFEGIVISKKNGKQIGATFTVRRVAFGVGTEKTFPYNSPSIEKIKIVRHGQVRRAKLYYLRERIGKAARIKEKI